MAYSGNVGLQSEKMGKAPQHLKVRQPTVEGQPPNNAGETRTGKQEQSYVQ